MTSLKESVPVNESGTDEVAPERATQAIWPSGGQPRSNSASTWGREVGVVVAFIVYRPPRGICAHATPLREMRQPELSN